MAEEAAQGTGASNRERSHTPRRAAPEEDSSTLAEARARRSTRQLHATVRPTLPQGAAVPAGTATGDGDEGDHTMGADLSINQVIDAVIAEEIEKRRFPEIAAHFKRCAQKLAVRIENLQKTNTRLKKAKEDLVEFRAGKIPAGQKAFAPVFETTLLDEMTLKEDYVLHFTVKKDTSIREAKKTIHIFGLAAQKDLDIMIMEEQRRAHRDAAKQQSFVATCSNIPSGIKSDDIFSVLDLDDGGTQIPEFDQIKLEAKAVSLYLKTVEAAAKSKKAEFANKVKAEELKLQKEAKVAAKSPERLLEDTVKMHVESHFQSLKGKGKGKGKGKPQQQPPPAPQQRPPAQAQGAKTKNGPSPAKGGGSNSSGKGKGKKGNSNGQSSQPPGGKKGKGRGKGGGGKSKRSGKAPGKN